MSSFGPLFYNQTLTGLWRHPWTRNQLSLLIYPCLLLYIAFDSPHEETLSLGGLVQDCSISRALAILHQAIGMFSLKVKNYIIIVSLSLYVVIHPHVLVVLQ